MLGLQSQMTSNLAQQRNVMQLQQSMAMQQLGTLGATPGPGQLGVQSLEELLYIGTFGDNEPKAITDLKAVPVFNLLHEFNVEQYYASATPAAVGLGALPPVNNGYYERGFAYVKFYTDTRMIPQQMLDIEPAVGNLVGRYTTDSFMNLTAQVDHNIFNGDSDVNQFQMDGVYKQIKSQAPNNVLDARGANLSPAIVEYMSALVRMNFGDASMNRIYTSPAVLAPFTTNFISNTRVIPSMWEGSAGNPFREWSAQFGPARFRDDRFSEFDPFNGNAPIQNFNNAAIPQGIPPAPIAAPTVSVAADATSQWGASSTSALPGTSGTHAGQNGSSTGYYAYCYAYINANGMGIVSPITAVQTVNDGDAVTLSGPTSGVTPAPSAVRIFRQQLSSGTDTPSYSGMVAIPEDQAVTVGTSGWTYKDVNADIPGTYKVFFLNTTMGGAHLGRLGPMRKYELAPVNLGYWYVAGWWGMLMMPVPWWSVVVKNVAGTNLPSINAAYPA